MKARGGCIPQSAKSIFILSGNLSGWPGANDVSAGRSGRILTCDPLVPNEGADMAFLESSAFFGSVRERLFAFQTREAVANLWRDCDRSLA
jgi:hypothetical protein